MGASPMAAGTTRLLCRWGVHRFADFPDPNTESGGLEKQGYRACTHCPKEKDQTYYVLGSGRFRIPM